jgi:hypothetical protein
MQGDIDAEFGHELGREEKHRSLAKSIVSDLFMSVATPIICCSPAVQAWHNMHTHLPAASISGTISPILSPGKWCCGKWSLAVRPPSG